MRENEVRINHGMFPALISHLVGDTLTTVNYKHLERTVNNLPAIVSDPNQIAFLALRRMARTGTTSVDTADAYGCSRYDRGGSNFPKVTGTSRTIQTEVRIPDILHPLHLVVKATVEYTIMDIGIEDDPQRALAIRTQLDWTPSNNIPEGTHTNYIIRPEAGSPNSLRINRYWWQDSQPYNGRTFEERLSDGTRAKYFELALEEVVKMGPLFSMLASTPYPPVSPEILIPMRDLFEAELRKPAVR
jgi:hypothetical protein